MKLTINTPSAKEIMKDIARDYLSEAALEPVIEYYAKCDEDIEFDPDSLFGYWSEYTPTEFYEEWKDFIENGMSDTQILETLNNIDWTSP